MDEFGRLFIPDGVGIIIEIGEVDGVMAYDVLFFMAPEYGDEPYPVLRLFDEDLMLLKV